jgi:hypothetical protein
MLFSAACPRGRRWSRRCRRLRCAAKRRVAPGNGRRDAVFGERDVRDRIDDGPEIGICEVVARGDVSGLHLAQITIVRPKESDSRPRYVGRRPEIAGGFTAAGAFGGSATPRLPVSPCANRRARGRVLSENFFTPVAGSAIVALSGRSTIMKLVPRQRAVESGRVSAICGKAAI